MRKIAARTLALTLAALVSAASPGFASADSPPQAPDIPEALAMAEASLIEDAAAMAADDGIPIIEFIPIEDAAISEPDEETDTNRVTFYDWYGVEIIHVDVAEGETVEPPEETPVVDGYAFQYWFDEVGEMAPFPFEAATVEESLNLLPHYEALPPQNETQVVADDDVSALILSILGEDATEDVLEASIEDLVPEVSRRTVEIVGSGILPASDRVEHVLTGMTDSEEIEDDDIPLAAPENIVTIEEIIARDEADHEELELVSDPEPLPEPELELVSVNGVQVSTLLAQILETGSVPEIETAPTPAPTAEPEPTATATALPSTQDNLEMLLNGLLDQTSPSPTPRPTPTVIPTPEPEADDIIDPQTPLAAPEQPPEPTPPAQEEATLTSDVVAVPYVDVRYDYEGELAVGTKVTLMAFVHNVEDVSKLTFQWQNDASGVFEDVPGATSQVYSFIIDSTSARGWNWLVNVSVDENE